MIDGLLASPEAVTPGTPSDDPCLVLENDAFLSAQVPPMLTALATETGIEHVTFEVRNRTKYVATKKHPSRPLCSLYQGRRGATAYALWPKGAAKLLVGPISLADTVICAAYDIESYQADPALVIQTDQGKIYNIPAPIQVAPATLGQPKSDCIAILAPHRCCRTPHDFNCIGF